MESLLVALPALGCVVMMPAMMWLMSRMRSDDTAAPPPGTTQPAQDELRRLRDEVARLRSEVDADPDRRESAGG
ncbi:MAG: hypothetical protein ACRDZS_01130 [Acidimicrobiales bacterium]